MKLLNQILLSSDAAILALIGAGSVVVAIFCALMEGRRNARRSVDRLENVGFMPWTNLFVGCLIIGGGCLAMSLPVVIGSL